MKNNNKKTQKLRIVQLLLGYPSKKSIDMKFVHEQTKKLAPKCEIHVITRKKKGEPEISVMDKVIVHRCTYSKPKFHDRLTFTLNFLINALVKLRQIRNLYGKIDLIHAHQATIPAFCAFIISKFFKIPYIVEVHGTDIRTISDTNEGGIGIKGARSVLTLKLISDLALKFSNLIITQHPELKKLLETMGYNKKSFLYKSTIDYSRLTQQKRDKTFRDELQISQSTKIILFFGRLDQFKDPLTLVKAVPLVKNRITNVKFLIFGEGILKQRLISFIKSHSLEDCVSLFNYRNDIETVINDANVCTLLSPYENIWSHALLECMALAKPLIITKAGLTEKYITDKKEALLIPVKNPQELAKAIIYLLNNDQFAQTLGENAFNYVKRNFNRMYSDQILPVYRWIIRKK